MKPSNEKRNLIPISEKFCIVLVCCFLLVVSGCLAGCGGPLLQVTRVKPKVPGPPSSALDDCLKGNDSPCELPGVPFYVVGYRCLHSTVWLQPVYAVTLSVTSTDTNFAPQVLTKYLGLREFNDPDTQTLLSGIKLNPQVKEYQTFVDKFNDLPDIDPLDFDTRKITTPNSDESQEVLLFSNSVSPDRFVDANAVFYYNIKKPRIGSANAEIDLSNEGILSKASGQEETKTAATILGVFPVSDLIKAGVTAVGLIQPINPAEVGKYKLSLQVQTKVYRHTHSAPEANEEPPCSPDPSFVGADGKTAFDFTVEDVTANPNPPPTNKPQADATKHKGGSQ